MMRRWLVPLLVGVALALLAYQAALVAAPRLLMTAALKRVGAAGVNRMAHGPLASDKARAIVRPSPDLAYSSCPFDLSAGPLSITVPALPAPYWSLSVFDANTDVAFVRNNGDAGGGVIAITVAQAGQAVPAGVPVVRVDGARGIALVRVLVENRSQFAPIDRARRSASCRSL